MEGVQKKYIALLGGSFDPAHKGHLGISKIAIKKLKLKKIYWVIAKKNPFKNKTFYSLDERIKHAERISRYQKKIQVLHLDDILKSSRSIDMINYFIKKKNVKNIYFMIGSDRKGMKSTVVKNFKNKIIFIKNKTIAISSTQLRSQTRLSR